MSAKLYTVNMGEARPSLLTVGYTLKNSDKTTYQSRTTTGVTEIGTATGIYGVTLTLPDTFVGTIEWDSGESNPVYASEDISPTLDRSGFVVDDVRTLLRAHLNQLVDFVNQKFKELPKPEGGVKELTKEVRDMKERLFAHLDEDEKTDTEWEEGYLDPILEKVDETNKLLNEKHEQIVKHVKEQMQSIIVPTYDQQFDSLSANVTELQKDVVTVRGDFQGIIDSLKTEIGKTLESMREDISSTPSKISIPNYESKLSAIEKSMKDGVTYLLKASKDDLDEAKSQMYDGIKEIHKVIKEMKVVIAEEAHGMANGLSSRLSDSVRSLAELLNELHPDTLERRKQEKQDKLNKLNFMTGVKPWQK